MIAASEAGVEDRNQEHAATGAVVEPHEGGAGEEQGDRCPNRPGRQARLRLPHVEPLSHVDSVRALARCCSRSRSGWTAPTWALPMLMTRLAVESSASRR
jgi:hypothetical protein